jgi:hypothetical protein
MLTDVRPVQPENPNEGIEVTEEGMLTDVRPVQP